MSRNRGKSSSGFGLIIILIIVAYGWIKPNQWQYVWMGLGSIGVIVFAIFIFIIIKRRRLNTNSDGMDNNSIKVSRDDIIEADKYSSKQLMTEAEKCFYSALTEITGANFIVQPQINLATIVKKESKKRYQNELYRNIDFGIIKKDNYELLLLIELNDRSHNDYKRKQRDKKVKEICDLANIPLITFWLNMPNTKDYITSRIKPFLKLDNVVANEQTSTADVKPVLG